jgi:UDP-GlcNAc:undecaprenyl-phosphate GlcNAc-1-phosphate transferase
MNILATSLLFTVGSLWILRFIAPAIGLVDRPGGRKWHEGDVPAIGGVAIFMGLAATWLIHDLADDIPIAVMAGGGAILVLGALDDRFGLRADLRLCAQVLIVFLTLHFTDSRIAPSMDIVGNGFQEHPLSMSVTILVVVAIINAYNLMDGIDGLTGGLGLVAILAMVYLDESIGFNGVPRLLFVLAWTLVPYLFFNLGGGGAKAKIFLGDAGSMLIGFLLGWSLVHANQSMGSRLTAVDLLWACALPLYDMASVFAWRVSQHRSPFKPDRGHIHHLLLASGLRSSMALIVLIVLAISLALAGYVAGQMGAFHGFWIFIGTFFLYVGLRWCIRRHLAQQVACQN